MDYPVRCMRCVFLRGQPCNQVLLTWPLPLPASHSAHRCQVVHYADVASSRCQVGAAVTRSSARLQPRVSCLGSTAAAPALPLAAPRLGCSLRVVHPCFAPCLSAGCSFSHDSRYLAIAGEQMVLDVENVETGGSLGRLTLRFS